jgi:carboxylate-amine ligase
VISEPSFTLGIEEEYLLVDPTTRELIREAPEGFLRLPRASCGSARRPSASR